MFRKGCKRKCTLMTSFLVPSSSLVNSKSHFHSSEATFQCLSVLLTEVCFFSSGGTSGTVTGTDMGLHPSKIKSVGHFGYFVDIVVSNLVSFVAFFALSILLQFQKEEYLFLSLGSLPVVSLNF